jgi:hypothetical protein
MFSFAKQRGCPSSAALSAYGAGTLSFLARQSVAEHLDACEFCGAESALLSLHSAHAAGTVSEAPHDDADAAPPVPLALRLLAESLFGEMHAAGRRAA